MPVRFDECMQRSILLTLVLCLVVAGAAPPVTAASASGPSAGTPAPQPSTETPASAAQPTQAAQNNTTVTILSYNDVQTAAAENGTLPRLVTLVEQRRAAHDNPTVVVGGGDQMGPHSLSPLSQWRVPVEATNVLDPAADVVGNHEFDYGVDAVANFSEASSYPWLLANVVDEETGETMPGTEPYTVVERGGARIGIVGVADEKLESKSAVDFEEEGYEIRNYSAVAGEYATHLKENESVDVVVVSAHLGVPTAKNLANTTEHVDAVVVGDDEREYPPREVGGAVVTEAEARAEHVSELNLTVSDGEVTAWDGRLLDVTENVTKNETVANLITDARETELDKRAGRTEVELDARFSSNYHDDTALGNLVGDSFRANSGADVAVTNAGGIRSDAVYGPGNLSVGDVYNVLPFQNTLVTVELTGAELKRLLASQVVTLESEAGQQYGPEPKLQVSGVTYEWIGHNNTDERIRDAWVNGEPLDENETYTVTVNSYMAGWDGSVLTNATRVSESNTLYGTALLEYVQANSPVAPEDEDRIRRVDAEVETESVEVSDDRVTVSLAAPEGVRSVGEVYAATGDHDRVGAESVALADDTVEATFDAAELREAAGDAERLPVYGAYNTSAYERVYFEHSVLNAEVPASAVAAAETTTAAADPTTDEPTTADATEMPVEETTAGTTEPSDGGVPGFGAGAALVALLVGTFVSLRRA